MNKNERRQLLDSAKETIQEATDYLVANGIEYKLGEWLTIKRYCEKFNIASTNTISNWIARGIIPPENVVELHELNGIKLIKAITYKD